MSAQLPEPLWTRENLPSSVSKYCDAFMGEFPQVEWIQSDYPYGGSSSTSFKRVRLVETNKWYARFEGLGHGCWCPRRDGILSNLTADLLAAAEFLGGQMLTHGSSGLPGGIGADSRIVWLGLLDGGVGVEVLVSEHEVTNRVSAYQRTSIRGAKAYCALVESLGFEPPRVAKH